MVPGRSRVWRFASAVARCPGIPMPKPMIRRLLTMAGIAIAGWLLGVAGHAHADQAHADTVPGARLPSVTAPVEHVTALAADVLDTRGVVPAVQKASEEETAKPGAVLTPARPPHDPRPATRGEGQAAAPYAGGHGWPFSDTTARRHRFTSRSLRRTGDPHRAARRNGGVREGLHRSRGAQARAAQAGARAVRPEATAAAARAGRALIGRMATLSAASIRPGSAAGSSRSRHSAVPPSPSCAPARFPGRPHRGGRALLLP